MSWMRAHDVWEGAYDVVEGSPNVHEKSKRPPSSDYGTYESQGRILTLASR